MSHCDCEDPNSWFGSNRISWGTNYYDHEITGSGHAGITAVRVSGVAEFGIFSRLYWPIAKIPGQCTNDWVSFHAGCGNNNGVYTCNAICQAIGHGGSRSGWTVPCGSGYGAYASYAEAFAPYCVYMDGYTTSATYGQVNGCSYGTTSSCGNPMDYCDCWSSTSGFPWYSQGYGNYQYQLGTPWTSWLGIEYVRVAGVEDYGDWVRLHWPVTYIDTYYTGYSSICSPVWYSHHAGCGNAQGVISCHQMCYAMTGYGMKAGWDVPCGSGYGDVGAQPSTGYAGYCMYFDQSGYPTCNYGYTSSCSNPMDYCDCEHRCLFDPVVRGRQA
jgi:hypothetical protein